MNKELTLWDFRQLMLGGFSLDEVCIMKDALIEMGFFDAPASTKYHGNHEGGLFEHSFAVTKALVELTDKLELKWQDPRSPYLVGMLHDLCKVDSYITNDDGSIEFNKNMVLTGHGDKSVIYTQHLMALIGSYLTQEEMLCIRWHMGAFDDKENWNTYNKAIGLYPNVLYTHTADMIASAIRGI